MKREWFDNSISLKIVRVINNKIPIALENSIFYTLLKKIIRYFSSKPIKIVLIILITAILTNIVMNLLFKNQLDIFTLIAKLVFLFLVVVFLVSNVDWSIIRDNSIAVKILFRRKNLSKEISGKEDIIV
ncbi:MAG: hypothetical protein AB1488_05460 [Nitrospirota bacterium]